MIRRCFIMHKIGITELLVILAIALLIFGPKALPKLGESIGKTFAGFKKGLKDNEEEAKEKEIEKKRKRNLTSWSFPHE